MLALRSQGALRTLAWNLEDPGKQTTYEARGRVFGPRKAQTQWVSE